MIRTHAQVPGTWVEKQITLDSADQYDPSIASGKIAWTDLRNGDADIYVYDIASRTEQKVGSSTNAQQLQDNDGDVVVYTDYRNDQGDIYAHDLTTDTATQLSTGAGYQKSPAISGTRLVWEQYADVHAPADLYGRDLTGGPPFPITTASGFQTVPAMETNDPISSW